MTAIELKGSRAFDRSIGVEVMGAEKGDVVV